MRLLLEALSSHVPGLSTNFREFLGSIVCDQDSDNCMTGKCQECHTKFATVYSVDDETANLPLKWFQWETIEQRATKVAKDGTVQDALHEICKQLPYFRLHSFIKRKQSYFFEDRRKAVDGDRVVVQVDFVENYAAIEQNEIQSAHWSHVQVTLFSVRLD